MLFSSFPVLLFLVPHSCLEWQPNSTYSEPLFQMGFMDCYLILQVLVKITWEQKDVQKPLMQYICSQRRWMFKLLLINISLAKRDPFFPRTLLCIIYRSNVSVIAAVDFGGLVAHLITNLLVFTMNREWVRV